MRYLAGETAVTLGLAYGVSQQYIVQIAGTRKSAGIHVSRRKPHPRLAKERADREAADLAARARREAWQAQLANGKPTQARCATKGCVYPAAIGDLCRRCFIDNHSEASVMQCQSAVVGMR